VFDVRTGEVLRGPATEPVNNDPVEVNASVVNVDLG
jgi:nitrite reductase/ring-hydroxylating ferredoxin subunit